jgi:hypothetical protein
VAGIEREKGFRGGNIPPRLLEVGEKLCCLFSSIIIGKLCLQNKVQRSLLVPVPSVLAAYMCATGAWLIGIIV